MARASALFWHIIERFAKSPKILPHHLAQRRKATSRNPLKECSRMKVRFQQMVIDMTYLIERICAFGDRCYASGNWVSHMNSF